MGAKLFVGNLSPRTSESQLRRFFASAGVVASVRIPLSRDTGEPRGFAFVEFASESDAENARLVFDGRELAGRQLRVSKARPEEERNGSRPRSQGRRPEREAGESEETRDEPWSVGDDPYGLDSPRARRRGGRHGSDRRRSQGTRRFIED